MNKTIDFFNKLTTIPRPSGHEEKINQYLINFAKEHSLEYFTDKTLNVVVKKKSNCGKNKTLILQAHQDMVCEKNNNTQIDFLKDKIKTKVEGDFLMAQDTTLGADNGVGLSMILSVLDDNTLKIPNLECVFTTREETTMLGAINLDCSTLNGKHLLSIDGTDEGKIEVSSAGMAVCEISKDFAKSLNKSNTRENQEELDLSNSSTIKLHLTGLRGGHSGTEINTDRQNAIKKMFEFLFELNYDFKILSIDGGGKSNAIPRECSCTVVAQNLDESWLKSKIDEFININKNVENDLKLTYEIINCLSKNKIGDCKKISNLNFLSLKDSKNLIEYINNYQNGVLVWDEKNKDFPIVSNNFANIKLENRKLNIIVSLRSSVKNLEEKYLNKIKMDAQNSAYSFKVTSSAPFFEKKENSYLQSLCVETYKDLYKTPAEVHGVHAGLEGGVFAQKIKDIDICVIAPNIYDCHSPMERVSLSSIDRVYKWLTRIVENF